MKETETPETQTPISDQALATVRAERQERAVNEAIMLLREQESLYKRLGEITQRLAALDAGAEAL